MSNHQLMERETNSDEMNNNWFVFDEEVTSTIDKRFVIIKGWWWLAHKLSFSFKKNVIMEKKGKKNQLLLTIKMRKQQIWRRKMKWKKKMKNIYWYYNIVSSQGCHCQANIVICRLLANSSNNLPSHIYSYYTNVQILHNHFSCMN